MVYRQTHLFVSPNFLVSVRHGASSSYAQVLQRGSAGAKGLHKGKAFALYAVLDYVADNYQPIVAQFELDFESIAAHFFGDQFDQLVIERLYTLKCELLALRHAALPVADISADLMRLHEDLIPKEPGAYFRDIQDHIARLVGLIDGMRDILTTAMQVNLVLVANKANAAVKKLAGWNAILAIPSVIFSLAGMRTECTPEPKWRARDPMAGTVRLQGCGLVYRRVRRPGWV